MIHNNSFAGYYSTHTVPVDTSWKKEMIPVVFGLFSVLFACTMPPKRQGKKDTSTTDTVPATVATAETSSTTSTAPLIQCFHAFPTSVPTPTVGRKYKDNK